MSDDIERARDKIEDVADQVGKVDHAAWKDWRVGVGYPDHAFPYWHERDAPMGWRSPRIGDGSERVCTRCHRGESVHHPDMVDWADLSPEKRQKYIVQGMACYEAGCAAAEGAQLRKSIESIERIATNYRASDSPSGGSVYRVGLTVVRDEIRKALASGSGSETKE